MPLNSTRLVVFVLVLATILVPRGGGAQTKVVRFKGLWDGARVVNDAVVVVNNDRIVRVSAGNADVPPAAEVIDLRPYFGIPGLIDLHTHMTYYWDRQAGTPPRGQQRRPAVTVFLAQENARRTLETGVTTVRDLNAANEMDLAMRDLIARGAMVGPRMFVSGQGLSSGATVGWRELVEARVKAGADWIKVYGSRGSYDSVDTTQTLTFDDMRVIVDA